MAGVLGEGGKLSRKAETGPTGHERNEGELSFWTWQPAESSTSFDLLFAPEIAIKEFFIFVLEHEMSSSPRHFPAELSRYQRIDTSIGVKPRYGLGSGVARSLKRFPFLI